MFQTRPVIMGVHGCISSSHYLSTEAGFEVLKAHGNAADAVVAAGLAMHVVEPHMNGFGGEVPILYYSSKIHRTLAISGQGTAPNAATIQYFEKEKIRKIPGDGFLAATVPGAFSAWITLLKEFGTMTLSQVIRPAMTLAQEGFAVYRRLHEHIKDNAGRIRSEWPTTADIFLPKNRIPSTGEILIQHDLGEMMRRLTEAERMSGDKRKGLDLAHKYFYDGPVARRIIQFANEHPTKDATGMFHRSLLSTDDLSQYHSRIEQPVSIGYRGLTVHKCGPWTQGPVFLQQLRLLQGYDLPRLGHNTVDYVHTLIEVAKLAFADREEYYGDPQFADVPLRRLLSRRYAEVRRRLINPRRASMKLQGGILPREPGRTASSGDTTHIDVVDSEGNMVSATPSGGWFWSSPIVKGLGFALGTRAQMFSLKRGHPNSIAPGKRPRTTLTPTIVTAKGLPVMAFGTPGGDQQDQWSLQFFLNFVEFKMNLQQAIDAPTFHTSHFPSSFYPRDVHPGRIHLENRFSSQVLNGLRKRGHKIVLEDAWSNGRVTAVHFNNATRVMSAAASPRFETPYALGW